jgi:hypothetical protein
VIIVVFLIAGYVSWRWYFKNRCFNNKEVDIETMVNKSALVSSADIGERRSDGIGSG